MICLTVSRSLSPSKEYRLVFPGPSIRQSIRLSVHWSVNPSVCLSVCPSVRQSISPSVRHSVILSFCPSVCHPISFYVFYPRDRQIRYGFYILNLGSVTSILKNVVRFIKVTLKCVNKVIVLKKASLDPTLTIWSYNFNPSFSRVKIPRLYTPISQ
jgi:hypothetical protein